MDTSLVIGAVVVGAALAGGALLTLRISRQKSKTDTNKVVIRDVTTTGDVAGRDINKRS